MKRMIKIILLVFMLLIIISPQKIDAARVICSKKIFRENKQDAYKVNVNYDFVENGEASYFLIYISNLNKFLEARVDEKVVRYEEGKETYELSKQYGDQSVVNIQIYVAKNYPCEGQLLLTKKITLPKYNIYSTMEECNEYEEFKLCKKWYSGKIESYVQFKEELQKYIDSLKKEPPKILNKEEKSLFDKVKDFYMENINITGPATVVIVLGIAGITIKKLIDRKRRIKIDF